jgi:hypothetical protein
MLDSEIVIAAREVKKLLTRGCGVSDLLGSIRKLLHLIEREEKNAQARDQDGHLELPGKKQRRSATGPSEAGTSGKVVQGRLF